MGVSKPGPRHHLAEAVRREPGGEGAQEGAPGRRTTSWEVGAESTGPGHSAVTGQLVTVSVASGGDGNLL